MTAADREPRLAARPASTAIVARPGLWRQLDQSARVTVVSAPAGSGKTMLISSWIQQANLADRAAFVQVMRGERDPQQFWLSVLTKLRATTQGSRLVREVTASPDLDDWGIVERLLADLARLQDRLWLVLDDLHELRSEEARKQVELLVLRAPPQLRIVLATRHDVRLGLHRLRLDSELTEIRSDSLRFTLQEAHKLFQAAGVKLSAEALATLHERAEGWAAGLRLAALSLIGHPDPDRFAAEFSGTERTVAEYLLAEVLARQPPEVRRLLLCTSGLDRVSGELADLLTGMSGGERMLQDLEEANAFVISLDTARSWFRYHHLFAELLQLELRRTEPDLVSALHVRAADWLAGHGYPVEAVRHAQAAGDWELAARLLADSWPGLYLDGQEPTVHALVGAFPSGTAAGDAELAAVAAAGELAEGSLVSAEQYLVLAERGLERVPQDRREQALILLGVVQMIYCGRRGDQRGRASYAERVAAVSAVSGAARPGLSEELRAFALAEIGDSETWAGRLDLAEPHLDTAIALGRRTRRPYVELVALVYRAEIELNRCFPRAEELSRQAIALAERHGWTDDLFTGFAAMTHGGALAWQGRIDDADAWVGRAERIFRREANPAAAMSGQYVRGQLEMGRRRFAAALHAFRAAEQLAGLHPLARPLRSWLVHALAQLGKTDDAEDILAGLSERDRTRSEMRVATAVLRLAQHNPRGAAEVLAPVLEATRSAGWPSWLIEAFLLDALARYALGDRAGAGCSLERALALAAADGTILWFLMHPAAELFQTLASGQTAHPVLVARILGQLARMAAVAPASGMMLSAQPLTPSEIRVLRYLPTHLSAPEIGVELHLSTHTVKTHMRNMYAKLSAHNRTEAVAAARSLDLLAPSGPVQQT
ncbi:MAG TPA: LuxR C-terminal-related transcriptional regulator [Streptosporangiaceae bacterium]|nr:LuxR C-terminal-related transcriptional regulator [Streptosporangiaceae bacterium]